MSARDEADILADMFGKAKPVAAAAAAAPPALPPTAPAPVAREGSAARIAIAAVVVLAALWGWLLLAQWAVVALIEGFAIADPLTVEIVATLVVFGGLFALAGAAMLVVRPPAAPARMATAPAAALGFGLGIAGLSYAVLALWTGNHLVAPEGPVPPLALGLILAGTALNLFQTAAEEVLFRGWLQRVLAGRWGAPAGIGLAALAFALLHVAGGTRDPLSVLNLFLGGMFFGLLAWRTGRLAAAVAGHFAWNWSEQILYGLDPNPGTPAFGALFDRDMTGSAIWGGSDEGLNASIVIAFALLALIVPLAIRRKPHPV